MGEELGEGWARGGRGVGEGWARGGRQMVEECAYYLLEYIYEEEDTCLMRRRIHVLGARMYEGLITSFNIYIFHGKKITSKITIKANLDSYFLCSKVMGKIQKRSLIHYSYIHIRRDLLDFF